MSQYGFVRISKLILSGIAYFVILIELFNLLKSSNICKSHLGNGSDIYMIVFHILSTHISNIYVAKMRCMGNKPLSIKILSDYQE